MNSQQRSDRRSLALHRVVVKRLQADPALWAVPLQNLDRWERQDGELDRPHLTWKQILNEMPREDILKLLVSRSQKATLLRSSSPFVGIIDQETRNKIFARYRLRTDPKEKLGGSNDNG